MKSPETEVQKRAAAAIVDEILGRSWGELMNENTELAKAVVIGMISMARALDLLTELEMDGWVARIERCPDLAEFGEHIGGRDWCAFCGDIERQDDQSIALAGL